MDCFRLIRIKGAEPYYLGQCKECEYKYQQEYKERKKQLKFTNNTTVYYKRRFKQPKEERILDIKKTDILPAATDETFVKLMDYKDSWLSNYGRIIRYKDNKYQLLKGEYDNGLLFYRLPKNIIEGEKWIFKNSIVYAAKIVVETFVVNPDKKNNVYIWHKGFDKQDYYYKNLYPLNRVQYINLRRHFKKTGDDSEELILRIMNDIHYQTDDWRSCYFEPSVCKMGYKGLLFENGKEESYTRWHDMINRCYNKKFHEKQPQYLECTVCEEWLNYSNFKIWYEENKIPGMALDLDKDIVFKGNKEYCPDTVAFVPHTVNTLFINGKGGRGDLPLGVYYDYSKGKYGASVASSMTSKKLGMFDTPEQAFTSYKKYKEAIIKQTAEQYKTVIPYKVYDSMKNWKIEIND